METKPNESTGLVVDQKISSTFIDKIFYVLKLLSRDKLGALGFVIFAFVVFTAIFAPKLAPYDPLKQNLMSAKRPPVWADRGSADHILGTDNLGRDILSRIIYGTRVSLTVGFFGVLLAGTLGVIIGLITGFVGGRTDNIIMGGVNMILALPYLVFVA